MKLSQNCLLAQCLCWCLVSQHSWMTRFYYWFCGPQLLEILMYSCGLRPTKRIKSAGSSRNAGKLGPAATLNQNPNFEMASKKIVKFQYTGYLSSDGIFKGKLKSGWTST